MIYSMRGKIKKNKRIIDGEEQSGKNKMEIRSKYLTDRNSGKNKNYFLFNIL